uniref:AraC family transcriptional regulator n=1 Tax=Panagrolaimus sp. ES5 TaxID=591445 RepID=A0AC34GEP0_9BILA
MSSLLKPKICINILSLRTAAIQSPLNLGIYRSTHLLKTDFDGSIMITRGKAEVVSND